MSGVLSTRVDKVCCTVYKSGQGLVYFLQEWSRSGVLSTRVDKVWCTVYKSGQGGQHGLHYLGVLPEAVEKRRYWSSRG